MSAPLPTQWSEANVHASPGPILVFDANLVCHFASAAFRETMGYDEATITGLGVVSLIHPDDLPLAGPRLEDVLREGGGEGADFALRVKHRSGEWQPVEAHFRAMSTASGENRAALFIRRSGRERRAVERALLESEERYRELFENANDIIYTTDLESRFTSANRAAERLLGYAHEELLTMGAADVIAPEHLAGAMAALAAKLSGAQDQTAHELTLIAKDGGRIPVEVSSRLIVREGTPVAVQGIARDITARKAVEDALREREEQFTKAFRSSPAAVVITDAVTGTMVDGNEAWFRMMGYSPAEMIGRSTTELGLWADPELRGKLVAAVTAGEPVRGFEVRFRRADGELRDALLSMERIDVRGVPSLLTSLSDITDLQRARDERFELERQLQEARRAESLVGLAGGIAHEFNNLLVGILGNAGLALMELPETSPARETIEEMEDAARRAATLAQQMLAYSGRGRFSLEPLDLAAVTARAAEPLELLLPRGASLRLALPKDLPLVNGDATQLRQVVTELVTNAIEALSGAAGEVCVRAEVVQAEGSLFARCHMSPSLPAGEYVMLEVRDRGSGIDAEVRGRMFEPFVSTKPDRRGLGLAVVLGIVRGHRGAVLVESTPGEGSTFSIFLATAHTG